METICRLLALVGLICSASAAGATSAALWGIHWESGPRQCPIGYLASLNGPIISPYYPSCVVRGSPVSICPSNTVPRLEPYPQGSAITVTGATLTCSTSSPTSQCTAEIGAGGWGHADVFIQTAGAGSNSRNIMFPAGIGIPIAGEHFDVYMSCDGNGQAEILLDILYTSP